nr:uncharacterized protein LOC107451955 isoform X3 [Parasteatoda tepidariorum]
MLLSQAIVRVSVLGFLVTVGISSAEVFETPDEIAETRLGVKTAFAKHVMEISDLLHMFIALINRADETEGRELGLPEITTTDPAKLESASLEELFDRFETAAQSFRTRFLKYLKTTETPYLRVTPTISTIVELNKGEDLTKYVYEHENVDTDGTVLNSETDNAYGASTVSPVGSDSTSEKATLSFILSDEGVSDSEMEPDYSTSTIVPDVRDNDPEIDETSVAFILSNEEATDSEMETEYRASQVVPDDTDSSEDKSLEFILSNEEDQETDESTRTVDETSDVTLTFVPITEQNAESFIDETTFESFLNGNFENPKLYATEETFDPEEESALSEKQIFTQTSDKFFKGEATLMFQPTTEDEEAEIKTVTFPSAYSAEEVTLVPLTSIDDTPEEYTQAPFSTTKDYNSDGETMGVLSTTEDDDSNEETMGVISTKEYDDSNEETMGILSTTEDDSSEETMGILSTTEGDDSSEESIGILSTTEGGDSSEESMGILSTTEDDDSNEETMDILSTTEDEDSNEETDEKTMDTHSITEDDSDDIIVEENYESDKEATSWFTKKDESSIEEMTELVKILREAAEKYNNEESAKSSKLEDIISSDTESFLDLEHFENNAKHTLKVPEASIEQVIAAISSKNEKTVATDPVFLRDSYSQLMFEDAQNQENISERIGLMQTTPAYSYLDHVIGLPGDDYPNYTTIAPTSFTCEGKENPGLYADLETRCQVFHACWPQRTESYLCPVGSTFNQQILSCDYWFNSTCSLSQDYYDINYLLQGYQAPVEDGLNEYLEENVIYPYNFRLEHSHPIFEEMKFLPFLYKIINYATKRRGLESGTEIDYNKAVEIEFDKNSPLPTFEDLAQQETTTDLIDSVKDRFRELVRSFVASEVSKGGESSDDDSSLHKTKLQERKSVYEKMSRPKIERSGILPEVKIQENVDKETTSSKPDVKQDILYKSAPSKTGKEQIAPAIVFKVLETAENVVSKGILPMTRELLAANYVKLYKRKKL